MGDKDKYRGYKRAPVLPHRKLRSDFDGKIAGLYDLEETIGEGHFAVVKLARHVFTGEKVAVKVIDKTKLDEVSKSHLFQEVRCMKLVQHPNVVRLYEVIDTQTKLYLILELGDGGDMYDYIMKHDMGIEEKKARHYFRQIVEAISYCHKLHVVHRDLKPENVVFFKKVETVKLTDFGFSNMFNPGNKLETSCGSLAYSAPEILLGDSYDAPAVDIWSLGVILYMLVCGEPPFQEANDSETLTMIMDCKYKFPPHVSESCRQLISLMLRREPHHRANLMEIETHEWLKQDSDEVPHHHTPLISREQVSEEDHQSVIEKMVEGCIATKEDILQSLEKDEYDHITATYYLLAERRLRKHRQEMINQAAMSHIRKHSAPPGKPHLEPLALSPRKQRELKKTKTVPITQNMAAMLCIPESPSVDESGNDVSKNDYFKSLTTSMTLGRRAKLNHGTTSDDALSKSTASRLDISPSFGDPRFPSLTIPTIQEPTVAIKTKKPKSFSKIAILSSFFEQKIAALRGGSGDKSFWRRGFGKRKNTRVKIRGLPGSGHVNPANSSYTDCVMSKEAESANEKKAAPKQKGLVMSLLSPQGIHPTPSTSLRDSPTGLVKGRKCSLIKEESMDDSMEMEEEEEMDFDNIHMTKSAENLLDDENYNRNSSKSPVKEQDNVLSKRPLLSVASSPQLLNQIFEENESEEDDDFVPAKLSASSRMLTHRNSVASPEVIRKYEARKKHRVSGSRGTSCSSSDASDTDDTEGRSRKDKLKHKFVHRRDSSDHSSDTDGGPTGHGGGGFGKGLGGGGNGGDGPSRDRDGDDRGKGGGKKEGKGGSPKSGRNHSRGKQNHLSFKLGGELLPHSNFNGRTHEKNLSSGVSNISLASLNSKSSLKYVIERDENVSDSDAEDNCDLDQGQDPEDIKSYVDKINKQNILNSKLESEAFSNLSDKSKDDFVNKMVVKCPPTCELIGQNKSHGKIGVTMDINSNMFCKQQVQPMKIETKCCSLV